MTDPRSIILRAFPNLEDQQFEVQSEATTEYNCIAWAAGDTTRPWWPPQRDQLLVRPYYWPPNAPTERTLESFCRTFEGLGFERCADGSFENGYEKIAFFADASGVQHAARQVASGMWTSKLGDWWDIDHDLEGVEGSSYGEVVAFMRRLIDEGPM